MSACCVQEGTTIQRRRRRDAAGWVVSGAMLALIPKCPVCLAGYVALATGMGLSLSTAWTVRVALVGLCLTSLTILTARIARSFVLAKTGGEQKHRSPVARRRRDP